MKKEHKSSKLWLLIIVLVILVLGGLAYFYLWPIIFSARTTTTTTTNTNNASISQKEIENSFQELNNKQDFGQPVSENEPTGRTNPFAPI